MKMFIVDAQLPPALANALSQTGQNVKAIREIGLQEADDSDIWNYALVNEAVIISKDQDFADRLLEVTSVPL